MTPRRAQELLYDSEASLRLVDNAIGELGADSMTADDGDAVSSSGIAEMEPRLAQMAAIFDPKAMADRSSDPGKA
jgi:hypothetical protein